MAEPRDADRLFVANIVDRGPSGSMLLRAKNHNRDELRAILLDALSDDAAEPSDEDVQRLMLTAWSELEADALIARAAKN